jgi:hypothetical protein
MPDNVLPVTFERGPPIGVGAKPWSHIVAGALATPSTCRTRCAMLYATGKRGHIIEALYLKLRRGEMTETFDFWMFREKPRN